MRRKEDECTRELSLKEQKRKELYAKQVCLRHKRKISSVRERIGIIINQCCGSGSGIRAWVPF
jgi:hypothetical protein